VLTVNAAAAPTITAQPQSVTVNGGGTVALTVSATNAASYQWLKGGVTIAGATSDTLILVGVNAASAGVYSVVVTNSAASVTSNGATLAVTGGQISRIPIFLCAPRSPAGKSSRWVLSPAEPRTC